MHIVAIGGGEISLNQTLEIDQFIVDLTQQKRAKALFIPTASNDASGYCETFDQVYGKQLGCITDYLCLLDQKTSREDIQQKIDWADLVYVGGGNTLAMMQQWKNYGVDLMLRDAGQRGCVLSGLSAGAICWFSSGLSDSDAFTGDSQWQYRQVQGLNLSPYLFCPHVDEEQRHEPFLKAVQQTQVIGIGADNGAAIWINNDQYQALSCLPNAAVGLYLPVDDDCINYARFSNGHRLPIGAF